MATGGRLIPAHAGKTRDRTDENRVRRAHPRSRGENALEWAARDDDGGSSPLTRGKLSGSLLGGFAVGLIPAHAGKTTTTTPTYQASPAHPRSRGENEESTSRASCSTGSSPLTRGKPPPLRPGRVERGLIPAHAGKTPRRRRGGWCSGAHPRSRGENTYAGEDRNLELGSSPLTRGKPLRVRATGNGQGLIPAHAGKTFGRGGCHRRERAHPRSRGENPEYTSVLSRIGGSSPLTRGKHVPAAVFHGLRGLIPAHAGKTPGPAARSGSGRAHPRSRGENASSRSTVMPRSGSSPLTRGKHALLDRRR